MPTSKETLSAFVPQRLFRYVGQQSTELAPYHTKMSAVTLLADISGFTALTEQLSQNGAEGLETLTEILNEAFDIAISPAIVRGGDVATFAGDAFLVVWPLVNSDGASQPQELALQQAACAALDIQTNFRQFTSRRSVDIGLRIGIGVGAIEWMQVGGVENRWFYMLAGTSMRQLQRTLKVALPGQVVVSAEGYSSLAPMCHGDRSSTGDYVLRTLNESGLPLEVCERDDSANTPERVQLPLLQKYGSDLSSNLEAFIPDTVLARLEAGHRDWLAEFRQITTVFVGFPDWQDACPFQQLQHVVTALQALTRQYEGTMAFTVDEKGISALVTFGLPQSTHTNDPERALRISLAIDELLAAQNWHCSIGVATGRAFCGAVGNDLRREYTTIGGVVNLAARLMQAGKSKHLSGALGADTTILCDRTTQTAVGSKLTFIRHDPIALKGRSEREVVFSPVAIANPFGAAAVPSTPKSPIARSVPAVVGREAELTLFDSVLEGVIEAERGGCIVLEGEAGIGKSQLLTQLRQLAHDRNIPVLSGGGDSIENRVPYRAWRPIFSQLLEIKSQDSQDILEHLHRCFQSRPEWLELMPLLTAVLDVEIPDSPTTQTMRGQVRADNTRVLATDIACDRLQDAAILILDDAHWMDSASWQLAQTLLEKLPQVLLVVANRPLDEPVPEIYSSITQSTNTYYLQLESLSQSPTRQLLCQCLDADTISDRLLDTIYSKSQGHPLFSEQLALALLASDRIDCHERTCDLVAPIQETAQLELPDSIRGAIVSRLDLLPPNQQLILKTASAIGRRFQTSVLQGIYPLPASGLKVLQALKMLSERKFTAIWTLRPEQIYQFVHVVTQDVAYSLMMFSQRRELHRSAAEWYEQEAPECEPSILAYHWERAERWDKALHYDGLAGERALRQGANREAVEFLERAIAIDQRHANGGDDAHIGLPKLFRQARWHRQLGDAYVGLGDLPASSTALKTAVAILDRSFPSTPAELTLRSLRAVGVQLLRRLGLQLPRIPQQGQRQAETAVLKELSLAYTHLGEVYYYSNRKSQATFASLRGLNLAEQAGPSPELAQIYANMCFATGVNGVHWLARTYARLALQTSQQTPQPNADAWVELVLGAYNSGVGEWDLARRQTLSASRRFEGLRDRRRQAEAVTSLAAVSHWQGDYPAAIDYWRQAQQLGQRLGDVQAQLWGLLGEAEEHLVGDQWTVAAGLVERAETLGARRQDLTCEQFRVRALLAQVRLRQGRSIEARQLALAALEEVAGLSTVVLYLIEGYASATAVLLSLWAGDLLDETLKEEARQACVAHRRYAETFQIARPRALLHHGVWLKLARKGSAARMFKRSIQAAQQLHMPYEEACAQWQLGCLTSHVSSRNDSLAKVRKQFTAIGIDAPEELLLHQPLMS